MDIAWRAEAIRLQGGTVYIGIAPWVQQAAALELLATSGLLLLDGSSKLLDERGREMRLAYLSLQRQIFQCYEVRRAGPRQGLRPVVLTLGFNADEAGRYMRRLAELTRQHPPGIHPAEAGFVGLHGLDAQLESRFFAALPREPIPTSDFLAAVVRLAGSTLAGE
jgi:hypothetical protein